jgi:hypothetical protein
MRVWDNILLRVATYYALLAGLAAIIWDRFPKDADGRPIGPFQELIGGRGVIDVASKGAARNALFGDQSGNISNSPGDVALTVAAAVTVAVLLTIPVAWVYTLTRRKKGYQQSMVQSFIILPVVVAAIVVLVKHSLSLAFSLGAIVAAVKFRSTLEDSKDAVYIFLVMAVGLACGVDIPVAGVVSFLFNMIILALWYADFGRTPAPLEGIQAQRRLDRAMAIANRTGAFVARVDEEILKTLAPEQLDALAERAVKRRKRMSEEKDDNRPAIDVMLRVQALDAGAARETVEKYIGDYMSTWRYSGIHQETGEIPWIEYTGRLAEKMIKQQVLYDVRTRGAPHVLKVELK